MRVWVTRDGWPRCRVVYHVHNRRKKYNSDLDIWVTIGDNIPHLAFDMSPRLAARLGIPRMPGGPTSIVEMELTQPCFRKVEK